MWQLVSVFEHLHEVKHYGFKLDGLTSMSSTDASFRRFTIKHSGGLARNEFSTGHIGDAK